MKRILFVLCCVFVFVGCSSRERTDLTTQELRQAAGLESEDWSSQITRPDDLSTRYAKFWKQADFIRSIQATEDWGRLSAEEQTLALKNLSDLGLTIAKEMLQLLRTPQWERSAGVLSYGQHIYATDRGALILNAMVDVLKEVGAKPEDIDESAESLRTALIEDVRRSIIHLHDINPSSLTNDIAKLGYLEANDMYRVSADQLALPDSVSYNWLK